MRTSAQKIVKKHLSNEIGNILKEMFPLNRSLTGNGNLATLKKLKKITPIKIKRFHQGLRFMIGKFHMNGLLKMLGSKIQKIIKLLTLRKTI